MAASDYRPRLVDSLIAEMLFELPAILLLGPRASGKTTTAMQHAKTVIRLDNPRQAEVFRFDPDAALRDRKEPVLLDEWQEVPEVLAAVKRAVDSNPRGGRFILTGSVRAELNVATWPGTGRVVDIPMTTLTIRERMGEPNARSFLDRIADDNVDLRRRIDGFDLIRYVDLALQGGFPEPMLRLSERGRRSWFRGYVRQLTHRDASHVTTHRDPQKLRRLLNALAHSTAGSISDKSLYRSSDLDPKTARAYENLLQNLFVVESVPAWSSNQLKRLAARPKRYMTDTALAASLMGVDRQGLMNDGDLLGRMIDTFVIAQLRAELPVSETEPALYHLRNREGREVDLIIEYRSGHIVGIEIKATSVPSRSDGRHLAWLRDYLGERFLRGLVLHTGPDSINLGERIDALPIASIWES
ncbi:MAG: ATP-binding protein [Candidatus Dormibacteraceae bacterium]